MANKGDILLKYKKAYPEFESQSINRLNDLKRSFDIEKNTYILDLDHVRQQLELNQSHFFKEINTLYQEKQTNQNEIEEKFVDISSAFNDEMKAQFRLLNQETKKERELYEDILETFENKRQEALDIYLKLTRENNYKVDKDMKVHRDFIEDEQAKLLAYKSEYDDLSAKVSNKMIWTIESSKNAIMKLKNDLSNTDKKDLISLNQKILQSLSDLRGTRNDINALFKETSSYLSAYKQEIYGLRKDKQKPYVELNQSLIHRLIRQIRVANENKNKYQAIIKHDLKASKEQLHPKILRAYLDHNQDDLEKYILQLEILEDKANYLISKIEKITHYNVTTYQKRIKEIKVEAFTRSEEIKFTYTVPIKYIENAINIYSNYNFYFNQGFNELDKLLSNLIAFSQSFNEIRDDEVVHIREDLADYQSNFLATITQASNQLSDLLFHIDEVAHEIVTLESKSRLEIAEIKKEILNVDIMGDYKKYLASLQTDYQLANRQYKSRIKKINIRKLYKDKIIEFYRTAANLEKEKELTHLNRYYNHKFNVLENKTHHDYYDYMLSQMDNFYQHQTNLMDLFMHMVKERMLQSVKAKNYYLARAYLHDEAKAYHTLKNKESIMIKHLKQLERSIHTNYQETNQFIDYLSVHAKPYSFLTFIEKTRLNIHKQLQENYSKKTSSINQKILNSYEEKHYLSTDITWQLNQLADHKRQQLLWLNQHKTDMDKVIDMQTEYRTILLSLTAIHYDMLNYAYKYHSPSTVEKLNDFYDDNLYHLAEKSIKVLDQMQKSNKQKKKYKKLNQYLDLMVHAIDKIEHFYQKTINQVHNKLLDNFINQIAQIKIHTDEESMMIDESFDKLDRKALRSHENYRAQQKIITKKMKELNRWMTQKGKVNNQRLLREETQTENALKNLKKQIIKIIKKNDKKLKKQFSLIHQDALDQYKQLMMDYQEQKAYIISLKEKIDFDTSLENQYIDYISDKRLNKITRTKALLNRQLDALPQERRTRLMNVDLKYQTLFKSHQELLYKQLRYLERDKFVKVPLLEKKIEQKEDQVQDKFKTLYDKHQDLENNYLNQYTQVNQSFRELHDHFKAESIASTLDYDQALNQPLKDLIDVQGSIIDKTHIIHQDISSKTRDKVLEIKNDRVVSESKQSRIINT